jgi:hypothetical protein
MHLDRRVRKINKRQCDTTERRFDGTQAHLPPYDDRPLRLSQVTSRRRPTENQIHPMTAILPLAYGYLRDDLLHDPNSSENRLRAAAGSLGYALGAVFHEPSPQSGTLPPVFVDLVHECRRAEAHTRCSRCTDTCQACRCAGWSSLRSSTSEPMSQYRSSNN